MPTQPSDTKTKINSPGKELRPKTTQTKQQLK